MRARSEVTFTLPGFSVAVLAFSALFLALAGCSASNNARMSRPDERVTDFARGDGLVELGYPRGASLDSVRTNGSQIDIYLGDLVANVPVRRELVKSTYATLAHVAGVEPNMVRIHARGSLLEELVPNAYRLSSGVDDTRLPLSSPRRQSGIPLEPFSRNLTVLTKNLDQPWFSESLLAGRHIAMWPSHGWYYEPSLDRWEWQRARLFQAVEDKLPLAFTLQYVVPMLENAGASVYLPRERDIQTNEVVVDNDGGDSLSQYPVSQYPVSQYTELSYDFPLSTSPRGFAATGRPLTDGENPFESGTSRLLPPSDSTAAAVQWIPTIPEAGRYAVYASYQNVGTEGHRCVDRAEYVVAHSGGETKFEVNQCLSFGTWVYLGHFDFAAGSDAEQGSVTLSNANSIGGQRISADAVRFGGGMGSVERGGRVSGRPRYLEGARYYLQYAGMPDSLVYSVWESGDYIDDYRSRGEWVNYLVGAPFGPNADRSAEGLNIPIDLSLAFHTDAGMAQSDTTIGTLLIYSSTGADGDRTFPDGVSRLANRDYADLLQTEIVSDMRRIADPEWPRRPLWDRDYSEAVRPNVPAALLELLAHQNLTDMQFALDPRFRFAISRSIYKATARFLAFQMGEEFVAQPLPVDHFSAVLNGSSAVLSWQPVADSLEPTAISESYVVYRAAGDSGWDNGVRVANPSYVLDGLEPGVVHRFKVSALNRGGLSFPSEILAVGVAREDHGSVLVVNGFDRVAGPEWFDEGNIAGFPEWLDHGVADGVDISRTGPQHRFVKRVPWSDDDAPGFGASYGSVETSIVRGNSFDFPSLHGSSILNAGYSFSSVSDEVFADSGLTWESYGSVDLILGEEKRTPWPKGLSSPDFDAFPGEMKDALKRYAGGGGGIFVSGAYIGSELSRDSIDVQFGLDVLGYQHRTDHAVLTGRLLSVAGWLPEKEIAFSTSDKSTGPYAVEAPDALLPAPDAQTILRFGENNMGAGVARFGDRPVVAFSVPFETIIGQDVRDRIMQSVLQMLDQSRRKTK